MRGLHKSPQLGLMNYLCPKCNEAAKVSRITNLLSHKTTFKIECELGHVHVKSGVCEKWCERSPLKISWSKINPFMKEA